MVEQIDRDAAAAIEALEWPGNHEAWRQMLAEQVAEIRGAERARMIAAMREPDAAMVEAVKAAIMQAVRANLTCTATAALAAAADHMETRDAG